MATGGVIGNGSKLGYSAASPVTFTRVGQIMNFDKFIDLVPADVDTTVHSSSNIMTSIAGMIAAPEFSFTCLADFDPATMPSHETLRQYQSGSGFSVAGSSLYFRVEVPVVANQGFFRAWEFQAYVKSLVITVPISGVQKLQMALKFTGGYWVTAAKVTGSIA